MQLFFVLELANDHETESIKAAIILELLNNIFLSDIGLSSSPSKNDSENPL